MKSTRTFALLATATSLLAASSVTSVVQAQAIPQVQNSTVSPPVSAVQRFVVLKNVPPDFIAYWLDPIHNPEPTVSKLKRIIQPEQSLLGVIGNSLKKTPFTLPSGVQSVSPFIPQNAVLIAGTEEGVAELQKTIEFLDRPLRQVEIEAQFVQIEDEDLKSLNIDFGAAKKEQGAITFTRGNFQATFNDLLIKNRVKLITAPRVIAINNMETQLSSSRTKFVVLGIQDAKGSFQSLGAANPALAAFLTLDTSYEMKVTTTINNDDTLTLLMSGGQVLRLNKGSDQSLDLSNSPMTKTVANIRDGDTLAYRIDSSYAGADGKTPAPTSNTIIFITPRIIRRVEGAGAKTVALEK
jgi:type II secretory pathway component GspD/PulD (secretin)